MQAIDVYTPWREPVEALHARTVGREEILGILTQSAATHRAGTNVLPVYLFGPRGCGKSHLLTLLRHALAQHDVPVIFVPEDIPVTRDAEGLLARVARQRSATPRWLARLPSPVGSEASLPERCVILFEALHKHLGAMSLPERRALRAHLQDHPGQWWVASGVSLVDALTEREEPLYGVFNPFPVEVLAPGAAGALLARLVPVELRAGTAWAGRADTLATLAGGSPRTLVALAQACAAEPEAWASDHLHAVVATFTAHYQMRFADLPPDGQRVVEVLSESPRELGPTEIGGLLGLSTPHVSRVVIRLEEDGVLKARRLGSSAWYTLAEPLFRYWHEYRTADWEDSRVGWVGRLVEAILSPDEMARAWVAGRDESVVTAIERIVERDPRKVLPIVAHVVGLNDDRGRSPKQLLARLEKAEPARLLDVAAGARDAGVRRALQPLFEGPGLQPVLVAWAFEERLRAASAAEAFRGLLEQLSPFVGKAKSLVWGWLDRYVRSTIDAAEQRGSGWSLDADHRRLLARIPKLRAQFLAHGKRRIDDPLVSAGDLMGVGLPELAVDWPELVSRAQSLHDATFWSALITRGLAIEGLRPPANPRPEVGVPALADAWLDVLTASLEEASPSLAARTSALPVALTWAASASGVQEVVFTRFAGAVVGAQVTPSPRGAQVVAIQAALTRLGQLAPARLLALQPREDVRWLWQAWIRAIGLRDALQGIHLHPELDRLRGLLSGERGEAG